MAGTAKAIAESAVRIDGGGTQRHRSTCDFKRFFMPSKLRKHPCLLGKGRRHALGVGRASIEPPQRRLEKTLLSEQAGDEELGITVRLNGMVGDDGVESLGVAAAAKVNPRVGGGNERIDAVRYREGT